MCIFAMAEQEPAPFSAIGLAFLPNYSLIAEIARILIYTIGEIASAYVTIAASKR